MEIMHAISEEQYILVKTIGKKKIKQLLSLFCSESGTESDRSAEVRMERFLKDMQLRGYSTSIYIPGMVESVRTIDREGKAVIALNNKKKLCIFTREAEKLWKAGDKVGITWRIIQGKEGLKAHLTILGGEVISPMRLCPSGIETARPAATAPIVDFSKKGTA